jgi:hypothetical protein
VHGDLGVPSCRLVWCKMKEVRYAGVTEILKVLLLKEGWGGRTGKLGVGT